MSYLKGWVSRQDWSGPAALDPLLREQRIFLHTLTSCLVAFPPSAIQQSPEYVLGGALSCFFVPFCLCQAGNGARGLTHAR
jgi:hypothetical protein